MGGESKRNGRSLGCLFDRFTLKAALAQPEALSYHGPPTFMVAASFGAGPQTDRLTRGTTGFRVASGWERGWRLRFSCCWPSRALQRSSTESADCGVPLGRTGLAQTFRCPHPGLFQPWQLLSSPDLAPGNPTGKQLAGRWQTRAILRCRPPHEDPTRRGHPGWGRISLLERRRQEARQTAVIPQHSRSSDRQKLREC